jgi:hypothetical protein
MWGNNTVKALIPDDGGEKQFKYSDIDGFTLNESTVTITKQDMDRLHSGEEVEIDGTQLKFVDESVNEKAKFIYNKNQIILKKSDLGTPDSWTDKYNRAWREFVVRYIKQNNIKANMSDAEYKVKKAFKIPYPEHKYNSDSAYWLEDNGFLVIKESVNESWVDPIKKKAEERYKNHKSVSIVGIGKPFERIKVIPRGKYEIVEGDMEGRYFSHKFDVNLLKPMKPFDLAVQLAQETGWISPWNYLEMRIGRGGKTSKYLTFPRAKTLFDESVNEGIGTIALGVVGGYLLLKTLKFVFKKVYRGIGMNVKLSTDNLHTIKDKVFKQLLKKAENDPIKKVKLLSFFDTAKEQIENHIDSGKITTVKQLQNELEKIVKLASKNEPTNESVNENKNIGHYEFVGNQILVDSNFVNYSKGVIPNSKLVHLGMGDFALKSSEGTIEFDRVDKIAGIGQDFVGRFHRMDDDKNGKLVGMLLKLMKKNKRAILSMSESVNEDEQLDEKLITFSNRAPYGQVVFMAGGAGSGKGFAISNFIDSAGFKVRDVDEMKKQVGKLDKLGKISVDSWYNRYSGNLSPDAREHVEKYVINKGLTISDIAGDLKNPNNVASLHFIVDAMGIKEKWLINMLSGKNNPETLPNLIFDITAKNIKSITKTIPALISQGYKPQNIHLIWVLTNYYIAVQQNQKRERVVPDDIMLKSHEGAARTIWSIVTGSLPKGLNGRIDVILGGAKNTVMYTDSNGNELKGAVKGFTTLPVKKQGGGVLPEKQWLNKLYKWVSNNTPKTITLQKPLDTQMEKLDESMKILEPIMSKLKDTSDFIKKKGKYTKIGRYFEYIISDTIKNIKNLNYFYVGDDEEGEDLKRQVPKLRKSLGNYSSLKVNLSGSDESKLKKYLYDSIRDGILDGRGEDMDRDDVDFYTAHWLMDNGFTTPFKLHETNDEFLNEGTGIHSKVRNWRNSKIKKPSGVKDLETMLDYLVNQGKLTGDEAKTLSHYSYNEVADAVRDFVINKRGNAFFRRYYMQ